MTDAIFNDRATRALTFALNGLSRRQQATSDNIANAETPGFKASAVPFEAQLSRMLEGQPLRVTMVATSLGHIQPAASACRPEVVTVSGTRVRNDGNNVDIDREMALLAETSLRYDATTRLLSGKLALLRTIINEGRR